MYLIELVSCIAAKDNWEKGCTGKMVDKTYNLSFKASNKEKALGLASDYLGVEGLEFDGVNKTYRQGRLENKQGHKASESEIEQFKEGKIDLWITDFEFKLYKLELITE